MIRRMSTPPRRLSFAVGSSLLTASLSLGVAACTGTQSKTDSEKKPDPRVTNPAPIDEPEDIVNEGPQNDPVLEKAPPVTKVNPGPEPIKPVPNPGPEPVEPPPGASGVNPGPQPEK